VTLRARWVTLRARWVTLRARRVTLRARWMTLRARWVTLSARWVTLRARWVTLRARWVTLRARWVRLNQAALDRHTDDSVAQASPVACTPVHVETYPGTIYAPRLLVGRRGRLYLLLGPLLRRQPTRACSDEKVANRNGISGGRWLTASAISRRPPISLDTIVARTHMCTYDAQVWGCQRPFPVAPCQT
jgi:hypothetical protein